MSYMPVGNCGKCGAPIYTEAPWFSTLPPPSRLSCNCFTIEATRGAGAPASAPIIVTSTTASNIFDATSAAVSTSVLINTGNKE